MASGTPHRKEAERGFHEKIAEEGVTPEGIIQAVMMGESHVVLANGTRRKITREMRTAAETLLPYRLPKLNAIDAVQRNVDMTHEEWLKQMDEEND